MAQHRTLDTSFWDDPYVGMLTPDHKLLFLYLKLNKYIQVSGCCQIKLAQIALETGLSIEATRAGLNKLESDNKIKYQDDWLAVLGAMEAKGSKLQSAVDSQLAAAPDWVGEYMHSDGNSTDNRSKHPAIAAVREVLERFPPKKDWDTIIETVGTDVDLDYMFACRGEWAKRGYNPYGMAWLYDWYVNRRMPKTSKYVKQTNSDKLREYYDAFSS